MNDPSSTLYVEAEGRGPPLVLLHGWGLNVRVWDGIVSGLASEHRVIRIDLPGHGRSPWSPDVVGLKGLAQRVYEVIRSALSAAGTSFEHPPRFSLLGWSLGGQIALELAASTSSVDKLILVGTTPRFVSGADWPHGMAPVVLQRFADQLASDYRQTVHDFLELQVRGSTDASAVLRKLQGALLAHGEASSEALEAGLDVLATSDLRARLPEVHQSTLVVAGQYDRVTPPSASRALAAGLPAAEYLELRRAAHAPFLSHPDEFINAVREFLQRPISAQMHLHAAF
jgi:pimeloyl-[acyl-carrier protein] methyl ester esterase